MKYCSMTKMTTIEKRFPKLIYILPALICLLLIGGVIYGTFYTPVSKSEQTEFVYIDTDDNLDSVVNKLETTTQRECISGIKALFRYSKYGEHIHTGRYAIGVNDNSMQIFRTLRNGLQTPLQVPVPSVRTLESLAGAVSKRLMLDSLQLIDSLKSPAVQKRFGYDSTTMVCMFIPDTYEFFWDIPVSKFLDRMNRESNNFWNNERKQKAEKLGMTTEEVMTLASIVDEETANNGEKPMVAGMYYNRLKINMPLQADPTVKFAMKNFKARRIYNSWLKTPSPYNTYVNTGLPPGPIRIPSVAGVDAVLNMVQNDYLYMCAKEDFSGTHNFARTYSEHLKNARRYTAALNARGIR